MKVIYTKGFEILISDVDYELVSQYRWRINERNGSQQPYALASIKNEDGKWVSVYMHRLITNCPKEYKVDHRDRNSLNNQRGNLRITNFDYNNANRSGWSLCGYKGVTRDGRKFRARIRDTDLGKDRELGRFLCPEEAARAYDLAAWERFGEFAYLNFPERFEFPVVDFPEPVVEDIPF